MLLTIPKKGISLSITILALVLLSACSSKPKSKDLKEHIERELTQSSALQAKTPIELDDFTAEIAVEGLDAQIRYSGFIVVTEDLYKATSKLPLEVEKDVTDLRARQLNVHASASLLQADFVSKYQSESLQLKIPNPVFYEKVIQKGDRFPIQGEATASKFGEMWNYEVNLYALTLPLRKSIIGMPLSQLDLDESFIISQSDSEEFIQELKQDTVTLENILTKYQELQTEAIKAKGKELTNLLAPGKGLTGKYPTNNGYVDLNIIVESFDPDTQSGTCLLRNGDFWNKPRMFDFEVQTSLTTHNTLTLRSPITRAVLGAGYINSNKETIEWTFEQKDEALICKIRRDHLVLTPISKEEALAIRTEGENRETQIYNALKPGTAYNGSVVLANGQGFAVELEIKSFNSESGAIEAYLIDQFDRTTRRYFYGKLAAPSLSRNGFLIHFETDSKHSSKSSHHIFATYSWQFNANLENEGLSIVGETDQNGRIDLQRNTDEWVKSRDEKRLRFENELEAVTRPGRTFFGSYLMLERSVAGEIMLEITRRSEDQALIEVRVSDLTTNESCDYTGSVNYNPSKRGESTLNITKIDNRNRRTESKLPIVGPHNIYHDPRFDFINQGSDTWQIDPSSSKHKGIFKASGTYTQRPNTPSTASPTEVTSFLATPKTNPWPSKPTVSVSITVDDKEYALPKISIKKVHTLRAMAGLEGMGPFVELDPVTSPQQSSPLPVFKIEAIGYTYSLLQIKVNNKGKRTFPLNHMVGDIEGQIAWTVATPDTIALDTQKLDPKTTLLRPATQLKPGDYLLYLDNGSLSKDIEAFEFQVPQS